MQAVRPIPPRANDDSALPPAALPRSDWYKLIIGRCIAFAGPTILELLMVIFQAIPARTPPELRLNPGSSLWSLNISTSHSKLVTVDYTHMKLLLSFDGRLALTRPSLVSTVTQRPGCMTSVRAKAQPMLAIVTDLGVNSLVSTLNGGEVTIDMVAKAKRRLWLGPWWVAVFDVDISCTGLAVTAPTDGEGGGDWMILGGSLSCSLDIIPQPRFRRPWLLYTFGLHLEDSFLAYYFGKYFISCGLSVSPVVLLVYVILLWKYVFFE